MRKNISKYKFPLAVLIISLMLIIFSLFLNSRQQKEKELVRQKFLVMEEAKRTQKEAEEKIYLMGKFDPAEREDFALVPAEYATNGNQMYLRKETLDAFLLMQKKADEDEVDLKIASAARNFDYQKNLWNNKWSGVTPVDGQNLAESIPDGLERFNKILEYSAAPGTSRHHWGTDIDINNAIPSYFDSEKGEKVYAWLVKNAPLFGFCQPYNLKGSNRPTGYNEEKWHWSYVPLARTFTEDYKNLIKNEDLKDFDGDEYVTEQDLINNYVLAVNPDCL